MSDRRNDIAIDSYQPKRRIQMLNEQASHIPVDPLIPAKRYIRSSLEMMRMARTYHSEGSFENAFVLYQKFISLIVEHLPKHPTYSEIPGPDRKKSQTMCKDAFSSAETIKAKLLERYEVEFKKQLVVEQEKLKQLQLVEEQRARVEEKKAKEERERLEREAAKQSEEEDMRKRKNTEEQDRKFALALQRQLDQERRSNATSSSNQLPSAVGSIPPAAVASQLVPTPAAHSHPTPAPQAQSNVAPAYVPIAPPAYSEVVQPSAPPAVPSAKPMPQVDRALKPAHFTHTNSDTNLNKYGLKTVIVPSDLANRFAELAKANTLRDVETGGFLCGKLVHGNFKISHVIIPKQNGKADSFDTLSEEETYLYQDQHELIQLGWIHTHPSQTAFLSSVDLHMHALYQKMMPEAIAIVVAPKYKDVGTFQLTPDHGLGVISKCQNQGFHPHAKEPPLFQECEHVKLDSSYQCIIADLRSS